MASITPNNGRVAWLTTYSGVHTYWELNTTNTGTNYGDDSLGGDNTAVAAGDISTQESYEGMNNQNDPPASDALDIYIVTDAGCLLYLPEGLTHGNVYGVFHNGGGTHAQSIQLRATATGIEVAVMHNESGTNQDSVIAEIPDADLPGWFCVSGQFASEGGTQGNMGVWVNGVKEASGARANQLAYGSGNPDFGNSGADSILAASVVDPASYSGGNWGSPAAINSTGILIANFWADNPANDNTSPAGLGDTAHSDYYTEHHVAASSDPSITDVETDEEFRDGDTALTITGADFEASQGTGIVEIAAESTYAAATTKVSQTVTSWSDTAIDFTALLDTLTPGANYIYVTNDAGDTNANGFAITIHRKIAFEMSLSSNFTDGAATTNRASNGIADPAGGSTFLAGIIRESTNEFTIDLGNNQWTHIAACIQATVDAIDDGVYVFEVVESDGTALDTYSQSLEITVAAGAIVGVVTENAAAVAAFGAVVGYRAAITEDVTAQDDKQGIGAYIGSITENATALDAHTAIAHYLGGIIEGTTAGDTPNSIKRIVDTLLANAVAGETVTELLTAIAAIQEGSTAGEDWTNNINFLTEFLEDTLASADFAVLIEMFGNITEDAQATMLLNAILTAVANIDEDAAADDLFQSFTEASNDLLENAVAGFTVTNVLTAIAAIVENAQADEQMQALLAASEVYLENAAATFTLTDLYSALADFEGDSQAGALMSEFVTSITELTENVIASETFVAEVIGALAGAFTANTVASNNFINSIQAIANVTANGNANAAFISVIGLLSSFNANATATDVYVYNVIFAGLLTENVIAQEVYESYAGLLDSIEFNAIALDTFISTAQAVQLQFASTAIAGAVFSLAGGGLLKAAVSIAVALQALTYMEPSLKSSVSVVEALNSVQNVEQSAKVSVSVDKSLKGSFKTND